MPDSSKNFHNKILGRKGEQLICKYLRKNGYKILYRNYVTPFGEADIIAFKNGIYCFVEVKTRLSGEIAMPYEAVNERKRERYRKIAWHFCNMLRQEVYCRFDVASICNGEIEYFEDAYI